MRSLTETLENSEKPDQSQPFGFVQLDSIEHIVVQSIAEMLTLDPQAISQTSRLKEDLQIDSVLAVELILLLEDNLGINIDPVLFAGVHTVEQAVAFVKQLKGA